MKINSINNHLVKPRQSFRRAEFLEKTGRDEELLKVNPKLRPVLKRALEQIEYFEHFDLIVCRDIVSVSDLTKNSNSVNKSVILPNTDYGLMGAINYICYNEAMEEIKKQTQSILPDIAKAYEKAALSGEVCYAIYKT